MSDLENMQEALNMNVQPDDAVVANSETNSSTPQDETNEQVEFYVDSEGGQSEKPKQDDEEARRKAAFAKQKRQKREAQEKAEAALREVEEERKRRLELEQRLARIEAGPKPDPDDDKYYGNSKQFWADLDAWNAKVGNVTEKQKQQQTQTQAYKADEDAEWQIEKRKQKLVEGGVKDFDEKLESLKAIIESHQGNFEMFRDSVAQLSQDDGTYEGADALYILSLNPELLNEVAAAKTQVAVNRVLKKAALMLKTRQKVDTGIKPTPDISSSGPINNLAKKVEKLRQEWRADPSDLSKSKAYFAAKSELEGEK